MGMDLTIKTIYEIYFENLSEELQLLEEETNCK